MNNIWKLWIVVAGLLTMAYYVVPNTPESKLLLYNGVGFLAVVLIIVGVRINRVENWAPWLWIATGLGSFLVADIIYYVLEIIHPEGPPFPSIADAFYLMMYPLVIVGLTLMVRDVSPGRDRASFIDAAVVATAMFGALYVLFVDTTLSNGGSVPGLAVGLAYPLLDVVILAVAARLVVKVHLKHLPFAFMVLAIASLAVADTAYNIYLTNGTFKTGTFIDFFWLAFYSLFAAAALHPSVSEKQYDDGEGDKLSGRQLVIMFFATLSVPMIDLFWGRPEDRVVTTIASALLFLLILVRVFGLMEALQRGKERLRHEAEHDSLTGLSNRGLFAERTNAALNAKGENGHVAVLFIDLDDFKTVNDSLGHQAGDELLAEVSNRIGACVNDRATVARFGGDEFAVLIQDAHDRRAATNVARRLLESLGDPIDLGTRSVHASASVGIAMDLEGDLDVETLMRNADVAMYLAKSRGKGGYEFFETEMHEEAVERLDLKADLQRALQENQFVLHYQPIFDLDTGAVALVEALIRWQHPQRGLIMPDRFIPIAEENGTIVEIGEWVLQEACFQTAQWNQLDGCEDIAITVNLSMRQLQDGKLINSLTHALRDSGLPAERLVLEITESMLALDRERSIGILEQIKTIGVKMAIDDFGTGYSSLTYLRTFPVDSIKIDRSFIAELHRSSTSTALIEAVVNLSSALGAYTVAEGIEHNDQAQLLNRLGCDRGQGFYYCRPLDAAGLTALLKSHIDDEDEPLEAWRRSSARVQDRIFDVTIRKDLKQIRRVADDIEQINTDLGVPIMGRWPWLANWSDAFTNWEPMMVEVRSAQTSQLMAYALLSKSQRAEGTAIVAMGHGSSLHTSLPARDEESAHALAKGIAEALHELPGAWSLDLEQCRDFDPVLRMLANELEHAQLLPELRVPHVVFSTAHAAEDVLSKNMRRQLRRARNRIDNEGIEMNIGFDRGRAISSLLIDEVEAVHLSRDRDNRRRSDLDRPSEREFWRRVCEGGKNEWEVEIATLRLNGDLAAYVVALLDGDVYRVYDGRMSSKWQHYSPGRLVESAALGRAITDPRFATLDWMSGVAAEKLLTTNFAEGRSRLVATSGSSYLTDARARRDLRRRIPASV